MRKGQQADSYSWVSGELKKACCQAVLKMSHLFFSRLATGFRLQTIGLSFKLTIFFKEGQAFFSDSSQHLDVADKTKLPTAHSRRD